MQSWEVKIIEGLYSYEEAKKICEYQKIRMARYYWHPVKRKGVNDICWQPSANVPRSLISIWFEQLKRRIFTYLNRLFA
jgi:hypothetical protein